MEKKVSSKEIYKGKIISVYLDEVELDDGRLAKRELVKHNGAVCIAAKDSDGNYLLVRQYRYAMGKEMLEFCAGKIEEGEDPKTAVLREVEEELGYSVKNLVYLGDIATSCGFLTEKIALYYADVDKEVGQHLDEDERITVERYSFEQLKALPLEDAKTLALMAQIMKAGLDG